MADNKPGKGANRLLKLMSVSFKEASMDSPSFRASANFYHVQVESLESWIDNVARFYKHKFLPSLDDFKQLSDTFFAQSLPPSDYLYNGIVENQLYTPAILEEFHSDLCNLSSRLLLLLRGDPESFLSALSRILTEVIEPYKEKRKNFDYFQSKHDTLLAKYQSIKVQGPNVEPSSMREDAFQLFEVRKGYLESSLDIAWEISQMQEALDEAMNSVVGTLIRRGPLQNAIMSGQEGGETLELFKKHQNWHKEVNKNNFSLLEDMKKAKQQVQAFTIKQLQPSRDLNDYNVKSINQATLRQQIQPGEKPATENSGWLFMKTMTGKPARTVWVRRWCFLKKSVFGVFLLSPALTAIEETDKFGVLLMNVRYDPNEERHFCFEAQIAGAEPGSGGGRSNTAERMSLVFQTETLADLRLWLGAFEEAKKRVLLLEKGDPEYELSFSRISPLFYEFACSSTSETDQRMTSFDTDGHYGKSILQLMQAAFSETGNIIFPHDSPFQTPLLKTPIMTKLTKLSIISSFFLASDGVPNAIMANYWGSVNWSEFCYNVNSSGSDLPDFGLVNLCPEKDATSPIWSPIEYPDFYPRDMRNRDIQFKSLFFSSASQRMKSKFNELLLLSFPCSWSPNTKQGFSGMCYVTSRNVYFYMNSMGFICLLNRSLEHLVSAEVVKKADDKSFAVMKLYDIDELSMTCTVFFDDPEVTAAKIRLLLENGATEHAKSEREILALLSNIDKEFSEQNRAESSNRGKELVKTNHRENMFWGVDQSFYDLIRRQQNFQTQYASVFKMDFNIPPRGLMHVLFGNKSSAFQRAYLLAHRQGVDSTVSCWYAEKVGQLTEAARTITFKIDPTQHFFSADGNGWGEKKESTFLSVAQRIKVAKENVYYEVDQETGKIKVPFAKSFSVRSKIIIITRSDAKSSKSHYSGRVGGTCSLYLHYDVTFFDDNDGKPAKSMHIFERLAKRLVMHFMRYESILLRNVIQKYLDRIGKHGQVLKAVRLCGQLALIEGTDDILDVSNNEAASYSRVSLMRFSMKYVLFYIVNFIFTVIRMSFQLTHTILTNVIALNRFVLLGLVLSIFINMFMLGKSSWSYWSVKSAENLFKSYLDGGRQPMQRALYIEDLNLLTDVLISGNGDCFEKFMSSDREVESKYRATRHEIALKRNELLVELKILNTMDKELVHGDYLAFLSDEIHNCRTVEQDMPDTWINDTQLQMHCEKCQVEYKSVQELL
ncbi:LANO_0G02608g1_1 [Lachancea nothofagi CBS 11611]|uniref:LANO_0G02608g1_1 n=1 Tax=Lachancea nothofagi CBS 11611 TaxID=1266666 RepID=A0A1G4KF50_9SACH|nr:LANO_0G02608g1_1 [Lachancea nothofagi CBS 11611]